MTAVLRMLNRTRARLVTVLAVVACSACENESLSMGQWQQVGSPRPPLVGDDHGTSIEELTSGTGPRVRPGDVVKVKVNIQVRPSPYERALTKERPATLWLWTGREPEARDYTSISSWGDLGSPRVRAALVGRTVGTRLSYTPGGKWTEQLPLRGFAALPHFTLSDNGTLQKPRSWPEVDLSNRGVWLDPEARGVEIEILQACEGSLFRRSATMRQEGTILNMFEMSYVSKREGVLRWSALEGHCRQANEKVRFEIGPLYYVRGREPRMLFNWSDSYRRMRPPEDFPGEYMSCTQIAGPMRCPEG
jgi:hypothetical protein